MNYITSPDVQQQVAGYLAKAAGGAPFKPTASPNLTGSRLPGTFVARAGKKLTVTGTLTNAQPGYPVLSGEPVAVDQIVGGLPVRVATGKTDSKGNYSIGFVAPATGSYEVRPRRSRRSRTRPEPGVRRPALTGGDGAREDHGAQRDHEPERAGADRAGADPRVGVPGSTTRSDGHDPRSPGRVQAGIKKIATAKLAADDANFAVVAKLAAGKWLIQAKYQDPKQVVAAPARAAAVTVKAKPKTSVSFKSVKVSKGSVTVSGAIKPGAAKGGATIEVLAMKTAGGPPKFGEKAKPKVKQGKTKFTARFKLKRGFHWVLRLVNNQNGLASSDSGLKTINVK